jgi:hypothetical protein
MAKVSAASGTEEISWDSKQPPRPHILNVDPQFESLNGDFLFTSDTSTSRYLIGRVAVGLVIVSGDTGTETFRQEEIVTAVAKVVAALSWLAGLEPRANVEFDLVQSIVTVTAPPGPYDNVTDEFEKYERQWRDDALQKLGYLTGRFGYSQYAKDLIITRNTAWSYVAFITKYPIRPRAAGYASHERLVVHYDHNHSGLFRWLFTHESCHIFGAADESRGCDCAGRYGHLRVPNNNCEDCGGISVNCLMKNAVSFELCVWSRQQIGWDEEIFNMRTYMRSIVVGQGGNPPETQGYEDYTFKPDNATRVLGGWWSLQEDASSSDAFKQFCIGGTSDGDNDTPTIIGNSITFRVRKKDNAPGLIRILFSVLYI